MFVYVRACVLHQLFASIQMLLSHASLSDRPLPMVLSAPKIVHLHDAKPRDAMVKYHTSERFGGLLRHGT